jgi:hypothetical protein
MRQSQAVTLAATTIPIAITAEDMVSLLAIAGGAAGSSI